MERGLRPMKCGLSGYGVRGRAPWSAGSVPISPRRHLDRGQARKVLTCARCVPDGVSSLSVSEAGAPYGRLAAAGAYFVLWNVAGGQALGAETTLQEAKLAVCHGRAAGRAGFRRMAGYSPKSPAGCGR